MYQVKYKVVGYAEEFKTELYSSQHVAFDHRADIAGYEGVYDAIVSFVEEDDQNIKK